MKIYVCDRCHYSFRYPMLPVSCPDCGAKRVREAAEPEIKDFHRNQLIIAKEIRMGLYPAV